MALLFFLSTLQQDEIPSIHLSDKVLHLLMYMGLGFFFVRAFRPGVRGWSTLKILVIAMVGSLAYGMTDEFHQQFVPTRSPEWGDLMMDATGGLIGGIVFLGYLYVRKRHGSFQHSVTPR